MKDAKKSSFAAVIEIWRFRVFTFLLLVIPVNLLDNMVERLVNSSGGAFTTANPGMIAGWRSPLLFLLLALLVFWYFVFEILSQVYLCEDILMGEDSHILHEIGRGFRSVRKFFSPRGLLLVLFITVAVPLIGIGFSISLTESFYIPHFISGVIFSDPLYSILYAALLVLLSVFAYRSIFTIHAMLIDNLGAAEAQRKSVGIIKEHGREFLKKFIMLIILSGVIVFAAHLLTVDIPGVFLAIKGAGLPSGYPVSLSDGVSLTELEQSVLKYRVFSALYVLMGTYVYTVVQVLVSSNIVVQLTKYYFLYTGREIQLNRKRTKRRWMFLTSFFAGVPVLIVGVSILIGVFFFTIFLQEDRHPPKLVAHRTGGILASENSLEGIDASVRLGVYGSETDIQRTRDGAYIINHDNSFKRLTGVGKKPGEMTLAQIRRLRIKDTSGSGKLLRVPTMEELLDRGKGRITLFLELKGVSADRKMVDDMVSAIRKRNMTKDVVLISLNYNVINYAERTYPEFETGILIFAGIGDMAKLNCDMIIMEEEMATALKIDQIHEKGKKAAVWTVNTRDGLKHFLDSDVDCIITDEIPEALEVKKELEERTDLQIIRDRLKPIGIG